MSFLVVFSLSKIMAFFPTHHADMSPTLAMQRLKAAQVGASLVSLLFEIAVLIAKDALGRMAGSIGP